MYAAMNIIKHKQLCEANKYVNEIIDEDDSKIRKMIGFITAPANADNTKAEDTNPVKGMKDSFVQDNMHGNVIDIDIPTHIQLTHSPTVDK